jgi:hypothetical protein
MSGGSSPRCWRGSGVLEPHPLFPGAYGEASRHRPPAPPQEPSRRQAHRRTHPRRTAASSPTKRRPSTASASLKTARPDPRHSPTPHHVDQHRQPPSRPARPLKRRLGAPPARDAPRFTDSREADRPTPTPQQPEARGHTPRSARQGKTAAASHREAPRRPLEPPGRPAAPHREQRAIRYSAVTTQSPPTSLRLALLPRWVKISIAPPYPHLRRPFRDRGPD